MTEIDLVRTKVTECCDNCECGYVAISYYTDTEKHPCGNCPAAGSCGYTKSYEMWEAGTDENGVFRPLRKIGDLINGELVEV